MNSADKIKNLASEIQPQLVNIRRHLHRHPELSFQEHETIAFVRKELEKSGIKNYHPLTDTGLVAFIEGKNPEKKTIALRADLDALPILEENENEYVSRNKGVMHACGHDVHTTCLLGAAKILHSCRDDFDGTIKLIFQPGEEKHPGGASLMIKEGVLENPKVERIYGQHVFPDLEVGKVGFREGTYMASTDEIYIDILGKGGHAALPEQTIDPIAIAAQLITTLQQVVSRKASPKMPSVLTFGKIAGGSATNIIPNKVSLEGTFRTFDEKWREEAHEWIRRISKNVCESLGGEAVVTIQTGYPFLKNDPVTTGKAKKAAITYLGADNVVDLDLRMTAEDFSFYSQIVPACFYRLGTGNSYENKSFPVHNSRFDIDEKALEVGAGLMSWLAINS